MGNPRQPNFRMRQLGRTLRRLRERAGITQAAAGNRLRFSNKKLSRIELGQVPGYHEFLAMLDLYGVIVSDYDEYVRMFDRAKEQGWWHAYGLDDQGFVSLEAEASEVRDYQLGYLPGLLQTEAYMRAQFDGARKPMTGQCLEDQVAVRLRRQWRLTAEPVLRLHAIIDESLLHRLDISGRNLRTQLDHLLECAALPTVHLQVIPLHTGSHAGRAGGFTILSYPGRDEPGIAYVEHGFGSVQVEKNAEVETASMVFRHLADVAFDQDDSITLIKRVASEL